MTTYALPAIALACLTVGCGTLVDHQEQAADCNPSVVGEWSVEVCVVDGRRHTPAIRWVLNDDRTFAVLRSDGTKSVGGTYTVTTATSPTGLDLVIAGTADVLPCAYRVDGDTMTLAVERSGMSRPTVLESTAETHRTVYTLKRVKAVAGALDDPPTYAEKIRAADRERMRRKR